MGQDLVDKQFEAKEASRFTSKPDEKDWSSVKILARYLKEHKSVAIEYKSQRMPEKVVVWSDIDFAGCNRASRSTSGRVVMHGGHCVKTYSQRQETIALSSGELEFYRIAKAAMMGLGTNGLLGNLGVEVKTQISTDTSA